MLSVLKKIRERALYKNFKFNIVFCMKVTGEAFSFHHRKKEPKEARYTKSIETFRQKDRYRTELWRALYQKAPKGQFLIFGKTHRVY